MPRLPNLSWQQLVRLAEMKGYRFRHQRGSHLVYENPDMPLPRGQVVIVRKRDIPAGTRRALLRRLDYGVEDVNGLLREGKL